MENWGLERWPASLPQEPPAHLLPWWCPSPSPCPCPQARPEKEAAALRPCFDKYVEPLLDFVRLELRPVMHNEVVRWC